MPHRKDKNQKTRGRIDPVEDLFAKYERESGQKADQLTENKEQESLKPFETPATEKSIRPEKRQKKPGKGDPITFSRRSFYLLSGGMVMLLAWVFILGVLVGRGNIYQTAAFQEIEGKLKSSNTNPVGSNQKSENSKKNNPPAPELTYYDNLVKSGKKTNSIIQDELPPKVTPPIRKAAPAVEETKSLEDEQASLSAKEESASKKNQKTESNFQQNTPIIKKFESEGSYPSPPKRKAGENFTVQVAASGSPEDAQGIVDKLQEMGFDAYFYQVDLKGRRYFRVRVGRYEAREQAKLTLVKLEAQGYKNMFISALTD